MKYLVVNASGPAEWVTVDVMLIPLEELVSCVKGVANVLHLGPTPEDIVYNIKVYAGDLTGDAPEEAVKACNNRVRYAVMDLVNDEPPLWLLDPEVYIGHSEVRVSYLHDTLEVTVYSKYDSDATWFRKFLSKKEINNLLK